jgi:RNA polymerase sigma factor (sigma-70 family)
MTQTAASFTHRLRRDRSEVFEELYEKAFPRVARLVRRAGGDLDDAKDVFHDALIVFYEKTVAGELALSAAPEAYVAGIARNLWLRRLRDEPRRVDLDEVDESERPGETARHDLLAYLAAAGRKCLELLQAFYYQRFSMREIAEEFGYGSERSATVQKYKCLERVREEARREVGNGKRP